MAPNVTEARSAPAELETVGLVEALVLCLLSATLSPVASSEPRYGGTVDICREVAGVELDEGQAVLAGLGALRGPRAKAAARGLAELLYRRGLERACEAFIHWSNERVRR
jgi:hypothetical protein